MAEHPPLIVTAALEEQDWARFEALRQAHFPRHRNQVPAHLTLFHALPGEHEHTVVQTLRAACRDVFPMELDVLKPRSLGRGVAYTLASADLDRLRRDLANAFSPWLTRQDQAPFRPHITVQNKVEPDEARQLFQTLEAEFTPLSIRAEGLLLWRYLGGPWAKAGRFKFKAS